MNRYSIVYPTIPISLIEAATDFLCRELRISKFLAIVEDMPGHVLADPNEWNRLFDDFIALENRDIQKTQEADDYACDTMEDTGQSIEDQKILLVDICTGLHITDVLAGDSIVKFNDYMYNVYVKYWKPHMDLVNFLYLCLDSYLDNDDNQSLNDIDIVTWLGQSLEPQIRHSRGVVSKYGGVISTTFYHIQEAYGLDSEEQKMVYVLLKETLDDMGIPDTYDEENCNVAYSCLLTHPRFVNVIKRNGGLYVEPNFPVRQPEEPVTIQDRAPQLEPFDEAAWEDWELYMRTANLGVDWPECRLPVKHRLHINHIICCGSGHANRGVPTVLTESALPYSKEHHKPGHNCTAIKVDLHNMTKSIASHCLDKWLEWASIFRHTIYIFLVTGYGSISGKTPKLVVSIPRYLETLRHIHPKISIKWQLHPKQKGIIVICVN